MLNEADVRKVVGDCCLNNCPVLRMIEPEYFLRGSNPLAQGWVLYTVCIKDERFTEVGWVMEHKETGTMIYNTVNPYNGAILTRNTTNSQLCLSKGDKYPKFVDEKNEPEQVAFARTVDKLLKKEGKS